MSRRTSIKNEEGVALFMAFLLLLLLGSLAGASLVQTNIDLKTTSYYQGGSRAFMAGEAGALHALSIMNTTLVWDIRGQLQSGSWTAQPWMYGQAWQVLPGDPSSSYQVLVAADPSDPDDKGTITATGIGPVESNRVIRLRINRSGLVSSPGAVYLVSDTVSANFNGNAFTIDGNDHQIAGGLASTGVVKPGISTRNDAAVNEVKGALNGQQKDNVVGLGFKPSGSDGSLPDPSVLPASGPSAPELDAVIDRILTRSTGIVADNSRVLNSNCDSSFGTLTAPQITHLTNSSGTRINGDFCGAGILIADGPVTLNGSMNFAGWIISRSGISLTGTGNSTVRGSIWTKGIDFSAGGSLIVDYSTEGLALANGAGGNPDGNVPRLLAIASWEDT
jgi:hypothetical protein